MKPQLFLLLTLGLFSPSAEAKQAPSIHKLSNAFPKGCGIFKIKGTIDAQNRKILLWKHSTQESRISYSSECKRCAFMDQMHVEAEVEISSLDTVAKVLDVKATTTNLSSQATLKQSLPCKNERSPAG